MPQAAVEEHCYATLFDHPILMLGFLRFATSAGGMRCGTTLGATQGSGGCLASQYGLKLFVDGLTSRDEVFEECDALRQ